MSPEQNAEELDRLLEEQVRYYRARAPEYEDWWYRRGRYDRGPAANERWFREVADVERALRRFKPLGNVLELACGTGIWTRHLAELCGQVTALDVSPEVLAINRAQVADERVRYVEADIFQWEPVERYDVCFFAFWLSHVPAQLFEPFWEKVARATDGGGRVFFIDSARAEPIWAVGRRTLGTAGESETRRLRDGREFQIVKQLYGPEALERRLRALGWKAEVCRTAESLMIYGCAGAA